MSISSTKSIFKGLALAGSMLCAGLLTASCLDEQAPGEYYVFTGHTVAQFLAQEEFKTVNEPEGEFSVFIEVLKKANQWGPLQTYGEYTCFAPTNAAFREFFKERTEENLNLYGPGSDYTLDSLLSDNLMCDTIARNHLFETALYTTDLLSGTLPTPNLLDRYLLWGCPDTIRGQYNSSAAFMINNQAKTIEIDDTVQNGVVHIVDRVITPHNLYLGDVIDLDPTVLIFRQALVETKYAAMNLTKWKDENYKTPLGDSCTTGYGPYNTGKEAEEYGIFPEHRYFLYTGFIPTDKAFANIGITNLNQLIAEAKRVYDESFPEDAGLYDDDFTHPKNPLNRFVAYHFLPEQMGYTDMNVNNDGNDPSKQNVVGNYKQTDKVDREDFFETLLPHSLMRISSPGTKTTPYINRKSVPKDTENFEPGVEIKEVTTEGVSPSATNGIYHYIDEPLWFSKHVREVTLNARLRFDCTTLSPDFINSGGRNGLKKSHGKQATTGLKKGFIDNVTFSDQTQLFVRYRNATYDVFQGDEILLKGMYDITFKIPPVPTSGVYEVRIGTFYMASRGVVQIYFGEGNKILDEDGNPTGEIIYNLSPCDIPLDMREAFAKSEAVGWEKDSDLGNEANIAAHDKSMRNRGFMKGMDAYSANGVVHRDNQQSLRRIIATQQLETDKDYYLRMRQVLENPNAEFTFDYIEVVPKSVYANEDSPENRH